MAGYLILDTLLVLLFIQHIRYRRQIKDICRQIAFLEERDTNMLITTRVQSRELLSLTEHINTWNEICKRQIMDYRKKDRYLKNMITCLSHDIRTPLTSLNGYFELLAEAEGERERTRYMQIIKGRIESLKNMLDELFTYTKLQNDNYHMEILRENMTDLVCENLFAFYEEIKKREINAKIEVAEEPYYVLCNKEGMARVIHNLLKNVLAHGKDQMEIQYLKKDNKVCFICKNNVEAPEEIDVKQVFQRFYKADMARRENSSGLGLAIAKELTEKMGGEIDVSLEGDCFVVEVNFAVK